MFLFYLGFDYSRSCFILGLPVFRLLFWHCTEDEKKQIWCIVCWLGVVGAVGGKASCRPLFGPREAGHFIWEWGTDSRVSKLLRHVAKTSPPQHGGG